LSAIRYYKYMLSALEATVEVVLFMTILWLDHAKVTTDAVIRRHFLTVCILFVYVIFPNNRALKVSIPLLGRHVCFCLLERRL
jgi:hypothetical protein